MEWIIPIEGDGYVLEQLSKSFNMAGLRICKDGQNFILKSLDFNLLTDPKEVLNKTKEIIPLITGASALLFGTRTPLAVHSVTKIKDDGTRDTYVFPDSLKLKLTTKSVSIFVKNSDGTKTEIHPADPIPSWIVVAKHSANISKVLQFLCNQLDWVNLYRIYEVIEEDMNGRNNIVANGWGTKKEIERFKHTANSFEAIGEHARHGKRIVAPKNPMAIFEAEFLIKNIILKWFEFRSKEFYLKNRGAFV